MTPPMHTHRIDWLARQMYSRSRPIGRDQIFAGFAAVLTELTGEPSRRPIVTDSREVSGAEFLGYSAAHETWRVATSEQASAPALVCVIDPILASMGVSGEDHTWTSENLPDGVVITGAACSSGRQSSWVQLRVTGVSEASFASLRERFVAAFPAIMSDDELNAELGPRGPA